jgi:hypothetical protein
VAHFEMQRNKNWRDMILEKIWNVDAIIRTQRLELCRNRKIAQNWGIYKDIQGRMWSGH